MLPPLFGIFLFAISLIPMVFCFNKKPKKEEIVEPKPTPTPKTVTTTTISPKTTTAESTVPTPLAQSVSKSTRAHLKPEPTQPSLKVSRQLKPSGPDLMEDFMNDSFEDQVEDDTKDDAQSLKGVNLEIRSESFPLAKKYKLKKEGKEPEGPRLVEKKSMDRVSLMKEDVTAEDTDQSVREQKKKVTGVLGRTRSVEQMMTKSRDDRTQSEKRHLKKTMLNKKTIATEREKAREKRRTTQLQRRRKSRLEKSKEKEMEKSREREMDKSKDREIQKSNDREIQKSKDRVIPKSKEKVLQKSKDTVLKKHREKDMDKSNDKSDDRSRDKSDDRSRDYKMVARKKSLDKVNVQSNVISVECYRAK